MVSSSTMPMYTFQHPESEEYIDVFFGMNDEKIYTDESGVEWKRVLHSPQLSTSSEIDPWDNSDFVNKTAGMKGTLGDVMDKSAEMSRKRAEQNGGVDPVKENYYKKYSEERNGATHPDKKKTYESKNVKIDFD